MSLCLCANNHSEVCYEDDEENSKFQGCPMCVLVSTIETLEKEKSELEDEVSGLEENIQEFEKENIEQEKERSELEDRIKELESKGDN